MRIAVIRGENIASLSGAFEVRLDAAPLDRVGLFAITGPTGAGKSTLLDCVCLALFDKVPRLRLASGRSKVRGMGPDAEEHAAADPRGLLRRGAGAGFAEVEFVDTNGARWRCRWSVRRARDRADGRLQTSEVSIFDADDNVIAAGRKADALAAIEARLGLGFEQFRRAALLAQGEFAAFLHADPTERATVLERVTGTELYAQISAAVYERWRAENDALHLLDARLQEVGVLPADERAAKEAARDRVDAQRTMVEQGLAEATTALSWHKAAAELAQQLAQAETRAADARAAWDGADAARAELAALDAVAPLRGELQAVDGARARRTTTVEDVKRAEANEKTDREAEQRARASEEQARATVERARAAAAEAEPALQKARSLDAELGEARRVAVTRTEEAALATHAVDAARERVEAAAARASELDRAIAEATAWLDARSPIDTLVDRWEDLERGLARLAESRALLREHRDGLATLHPRLEAARKLVGERADAHRVAEVAVRDATLRRDAAAGAIQPDARARLEGLRRSLETRRAALADARRISEALALRGAERDRAAGRAEAARTAIEAAAASILTHEKSAGSTLVRLEEARGALDRVRASMSVEGHREHLIDGTPCPLCGATEHPWSDGGAPGSGAQHEQESRVRELESTLRDAHEAVASSRAAQEAATAALARATADVADAERDMAERRGAWAELRTQHAELPDDPVSDGLVGLGVALDDDSRSLDEEQAALAAAEAELATARAELEAHTQALATVERQLASERDLVATLTADEVRIAGQERAEAARVAERESDLEGALAPLVPWPPDDVEAVATEVAGLVAKAADRLRARREAGAELQACKAGGTEAAAALAALETSATRLVASRDAAASRLSELESSRAEILGGRPTAEVAEALARSQREAEEALSAAVEARSETRAQAAGAQARLEEARRDLVEAVASVAAAEAALDRVLAPLDLDEAGLRARLTRSPAEVRALRADQERLRSELDQSVAVVEERTKRQAKHHSGPLPPPRALVEDKLGMLEQLKRQAQQEHAELVADLQNDDNARLRAVTLAAERTDQEATLATWHTLKDLIGSQDGRTFKRFAQSLTLDALLAHANRHLDDLAPRFRLVRVPGSELDLQVVDRTMGDEVRAVHTLSGGETFLASLSLALGLASLSAADTPVESLFIDEGFGTLDRETLDTALAALDALQATGRQVGIISHVAGLAERIGVQVRVVPQGAGRSRVEVRG